MSREVFVTWVVNGMGGTVFKGAPSRDAAISLAVDEERYDRESWEFEEEVLERREVVVDEGADNEMGGVFTHVYAISPSGNATRGLGIHPLERCCACRQVWEKPYEY